jgi:GTP-binding protein EngB required for normal cell division
MESVINTARSRHCSSASLEVGVERMFRATITRCSTSRWPSASRDDDVHRLTAEVFSRGSQYWRNSNHLRAIPDGNHSYPEIAFVGEVNSGRSSVIRAVTRSYRYGKVGKRLGMTETLAFYNVGNCFMLVDTPGFGWWEPSSSRLKARTTKFVAAQGQALTLQYLAMRKHANLRRVYWTIPANKPELSPIDHFIGTFLHKERIPYTILLTKFDVALEPNMRKPKKTHPERRNIDVDVSLGSLKRREQLIQTTFTDLPTRLMTLLKPFVRQRVGRDRETEIEQDVPILTVSAERGDNIGMLRMDMVYNCTEELADEHVDMEHFRRLSYAPATAAFQIAVENTYDIAMAEQLYVTHAGYIHKLAAGEPTLASERAVLGLQAGGPITTRSVDSFLEDSHHSIIGTTSPLQLPSDKRQEPILSLPTPQSNAGSDAVIVSTSQPRVHETTEDEMRSNAQAALGAMVAIGASSLSRPRDQPHESQPEDSSPAAVNRFLAENLERRIERRGELMTVDPTWATMSSDTQRRSLGRAKSQERFEAAVDGIRTQVLNNPQPFRDNHQKVLQRENNRISRKYVKMTDRHEPSWRIDASAYLNPFTNLDQKHAVQGESHVADRTLGAGYRMDGLRQKPIFGVTHGTTKQGQKSHRWARQVSRNVQ